MQPLHSRRGSVYGVLYISTVVVIYKSNGGRTTETRQAGKQEITPPKRGSSLQITLIRLRLRQGSLDRRREKVIWKMFSIHLITMNFDF